MRTPAGRNYETTLASLLRVVKGHVAGIPLRWQKGVLVCFALLLFSAIWGIGISLEAWLEQFIGSGVDESRLGVANVPLTLLPNAVLAGDVCLDGSPPGFYFNKGSGSGSNNWLVFLEGGGWCKNERDCAARSRTHLGSSKYFPNTYKFQGIMSNDSTVNPDFHSWNIALLKYCDGASFAGDREEAVIVGGRTIWFRGQRVWTLLITELLTLGLRNASTALLGGCSAGGLAAGLHCEDFAKFLPPKATVKCIMDGGFFVDQPDILGKNTIREFYQKVIYMQDVRMDKKCLSARLTAQHWQCFFPEYFVRFITRPLFVANSLYDTWMIGNIVAPLSSANEWTWGSCRKFRNPSCSGAHLNVLHPYKDAVVEATRPVLNSDKGGLFLDSCFLHCQAMWSDRWNLPESPRIGNQTLAQTVGAWFFERSRFKQVDCPWPCNPTCHA